MEISQNNEFRLIYQEKHEFFRSKSRKEAITIVLNKKRFKVQNIQEPEGKIVEKVTKKTIFILIMTDFLGYIL